jgi:hypothetical protein
MPSDHAPNKCYYKPNRNKPRYFTEADAARIFCQAKADSGATEVGFIRRCKCWDSKTSECEELRQYIQSILEALAAIILIIALPQSLIVRALLALTRFIPAGLLARLGLTKLLAELPRASAELKLILEGLEARVRLPPP